MPTQHGKQKPPSTRGQLGGGGYPNSQIADIALSKLGQNLYTAGDLDHGQCKQAVNDWVATASAGTQRLGGNYYGNYAANGGVRVPRDEAIQGDIIQLDNPADSKNYYYGMHTAVVLTHTGGSNSFFVVDSNFKLDDTVREHSWDPYATAAKYKLRLTIWRMGTADSTPNNGGTFTGPGGSLAMRTWGPLDFNGDGASDLVVYSGGQWAVRNGAAPHDYIAQGVSLGGSGCTPLVADVNGDGTPDFIIDCGGHWAAKSGASPYSYLFQGISLGGSGDIPLVGNFNGNNNADIAVDSGGQWAAKDPLADTYIFQGVGLGGSTDIPLVADFNGDGVADIAVDSGGQWAAKSGASQHGYLFQGIGLGGSSDVALVGDFNGNNEADIVVDSGGQWAAKNPLTDSYIFQGVSLGGPSDAPLVGDFNADGNSDIAVDSGGLWAARDGQDPQSYIFEGITLGGPSDYAG